MLKADVLSDDNEKRSMFEGDLRFKDFSKATPEPGPMGDFVRLLFFELIFFRN